MGPLLNGCVIVFINSIFCRAELLSKFVGTVFTAIQFSYNTQKLSSDTAFHLQQAATRRTIAYRIVSRPRTDYLIENRDVT